MAQHIHVALQLVNMVARVWHSVVQAFDSGELRCFAGEFLLPQPDRQRGNGQGRRTGALRSGGQQVCRAKLHTKQKVNLHSCRQDRTRQANNRDKGQGGNGLGTAHKKSGGGDTMQKGIGST